MKTKVRAVIVVNNELLLIHRQKNEREYWVFPGGSVEENDASKEEALIRECNEELGVEVLVQKLFAKEEPNRDNGNHLELFYQCRVTGGEIGTGQGPEFTIDSGYQGTYDLEWIPLTKLSGYIVFPKSVKDKTIKELM